MLLRNLFVSVVLIWVVNGSNQRQLKDDESWYNQQQGLNVQNQDYSPIIGTGPSHNQLLELQRQIIITQQMLRLYQERLKVLKQLRCQVRKKIVRSNQNKQQKIKSIQVKAVQDQQLQMKPSTSQSQYPYSHPFKYPKHSPVQILLNRYEIPMYKGEDALQDESGRQYQEGPVGKGWIRVVPPFLIDREKSMVSLIDQRGIEVGCKYEFSRTSNRVLFYSVSKVNSIRNANRQQGTQIQYQKYTLNLALQIKPNKIKRVKVTYTNRPQNDSEVSRGFQVQELATQYQSHQLINQNFKWHNSLDFQNLLVGFAQQTVYVKSKDKKMHKIHLGSRVISIHSINQYKLLYIAEKTIGTINVRSLLITEEFSFEHYLGNRTLAKLKQAQKTKQHQNNQQPQQQQNYNQSAYSSYFWHFPCSTLLSQIKSVAVLNIDQTSKLFLVLLSNADLLLYSNDRIVASTNLGNQLMRQLNFKHVSNQVSSHIHYRQNRPTIKIELTSSYNHILVSSNKHNKLLVYNVSIPNLSYVSRSASWFSFSQKSSELKSRYWMAVQFPTKSYQNKDQVQNGQQQSQIMISQKASQPKRVSKEFLKLPQADRQGSLMVYYSFNERIQPDACKFIINQYRLLLDLQHSSHFDFSTNSFINPSGKSQPRSYWWNVFMLLVIVAGVLLFRKFKQINSKDNRKLEQQLLATRNILGPNKHKSHFQAQAKKRNNPDKQLKGPTTKSTINANTSPQYSNNIISQLQLYLEKQGQHLSKQQLTQLVQDLQQQGGHEQTQMGSKPHMRGQQLESPSKKQSQQKRGSVRNIQKKRGTPEQTLAKLKDNNKKKKQ